MVETWDGIVRWSTTFTLNNDPDAYEHAHEFFAQHNRNATGQVITVKVADLSPSVLKKFRFVHPIAYFEERVCPIEPYFFGCWLGDGTSTSPHITNVDPEIIDYIHDYAARHGFIVRVRGIVYSLITVGQKNNPLLTNLRDLKVIKDKHIPEVYLNNTIESRLQVLAGLIDTDGSIGKDSQYYEITQKSKRLSDDICTLATSLGFVTRIKEKEGYASNTEAKTRRTYYRITIFFNVNTPDIPVKIPRKQFDRTTVKFRRGIKMALEKPVSQYKNVWSDEMIESFADTIKRYSSITGRVAWKSMVEQEPLYGHLSPGALRARHTNDRKAACE